MSQKTSRKTQNAATSDEKEKRQTDSPVKEMKKKLAANAEKERQADKQDKSDKPDKIVEKNDNAPDKSGSKSDKVEKKVDKPVEKKVEKPAEKKVDKPVEKKADKPAEKKTEQTEKKEEGKNEKNAKPQEKPKQNGKPENGQAHNGTEDNGTVSDSEDELIIEDEMFPELTYDDTSDTDAYDDVPRSYTRRSQVKSTKTPETPRPASEKDDDSKESKILKLAEPPVSDRKLRSSDSPKPEGKKTETQKKDDKVDDKASKADDKASKADDKASKDDKSKQDGEENKKAAGQKEKEVEIVIEVEGENESRVKTRARVSPYSRPQQHDQTSTSILANYTGNNTTMEMDITESSLSEPPEQREQPELESSGYLRAIRSMRGRVSYRHLDVDLTQLLAHRAQRQALNHSAPEASRPTGTVVGRKRKPEPEPEPDVSVEEAREVTEAAPSGKRMRLLDTLAGGLRRGLPSRRNAQIVGINTDLPLSAPVATPAFDPESLKTEPLSTTTTPPQHEKRCIIM